MVAGGTVAGGTVAGGTVAGAGATMTMTMMMVIMTGEVGVVAAGAVATMMTKQAPSSDWEVIDVTGGTWFRGCYLAMRRSMKYFFHITGGENPQFDSAGQPFDDPTAAATHAVSVASEAKAQGLKGVSVIVIDNKGKMIIGIPVD